jgi:hypothetical protein
MKYRCFEMLIINRNKVVRHKSTIDYTLRFDGKMTKIPSRVAY